jgi:transposase
MRRRAAYTIGRLVGLLETLDRKLAPFGEQGRMHPSLEVVMRPPSVFVRELSPGEGERLKRMARRAKHFSTRQRAAIVLASASRHTVPQIAAMWQTDESHVRKVIHEFNERGLDSLRPEYRGGRPRRITADQRKRIVAVAGARPDTLGEPFTRWSLPKLAAYLREREICEISPAHLGRVLAAAGLSFQRTRSWKASPDPDYEAKAARVLSLYERCPDGAAVISFDQMGPISLRPTHGSGWARRTRPERHRATFNRRHGVRYGFGALDVHADRLRLRLLRRRRGQDTLAFMRQIRLCYPRRTRLYWIQDNLSANWTPDIRQFAERNNIELVPLPTYASYLNRIEAHFRPVTEFVVNNADYLDWDSFRHALANHVRHRNGPDRDRRIAERERKLMVAA